MTALLVGFADCLWLGCVGLEGRINVAHPILGSPVASAQPHNRSQDCLLDGPVTADRLELKRAMRKSTWSRTGEEMDGKMVDTVALSLGQSSRRT